MSHNSISFTGQSYLARAHFFVSTKKAYGHGDVMIENAHTAHYKFSANQL